MINANLLILSMQAILALSWSFYTHLSEQLTNTFIYPAYFKLKTFATPYWARSFVNIKRSFTMCFILPLQEKGTNYL